MNKLSLTQKNKKLIAVLLTVLFAGVLLLLGWKIGGPLVKYISEPEKFREFIDGYGIFSRFIFVGLVILQVVIAVIPGEPFEIAAGYIFGAIEGTILSIIGTFIGSIIVFCFVRYFGVKVVEIFFSREKINSMKFLKNSKRLTLITYIVFLIPGTPKDLLTYFAGLTNIKLSSWVIISLLARSPSIITSTVGGDALGIQKYELAVIVFAITILISVIGLVVYNFISKHKEDKNANN